MLRSLRMTLTVVALWPALAHAEASPPDLDCTKGFNALHNWAAWLPGASQANVNGRDVISLVDPEVWRVEITFTEPGQTAHPAIVLRKFIKQVTGVWTAQSKACVYGDQIQSTELVAEMKAEDSRLTNASRDEVEQQKKAASPLGSP